MNRPLFFTCVFFATCATVFAPPPEPIWWSDQDTRVVDPNAAHDPLAPANLGQLKFMAWQGAQHLDEWLSGGAGPAIHDLIEDFEPKAGVSYTPQQLEQIRLDNLAPINLAQLKNVAFPFYETLRGAGYDTRENIRDRTGNANWPHDFPWNPETPVGENLAPANLAQLKMVFSFDLTDEDHDGLLDVWEQYKFGGLSRNSTTDTDGDGIPDVNEIRAGTNWNDFWNGQAARLWVVSGNGQRSSTANATLPYPLTVKVTNFNGVPASGTVSFEVDSVTFDSQYNEIDFGSVTPVNSGQIDSTGLAKANVTTPAELPGYTEAILVRALFNNGYAVVEVGFHAFVEPENTYPRPPEPPGRPRVSLAPNLSNPSLVNATITWEDNSYNETGFKIERTSNGVNWTLLQTVAADVTTYTDTNQQAGVGYYYRITPVMNTPPDPPPAGSSDPPSPQPSESGGAQVDADEDGLTNDEEGRYATNPNLKNTDSDGAEDALDGWALDPLLAVPRFPEPRFAVIDLAKAVPSAASSSAIALNDAGKVLFSEYDDEYDDPSGGNGINVAWIWDGGTRVNISTDPANRLISPVGMSNNSEVIGNRHKYPYPIPAETKHPATKISPSQSVPTALNASSEFSHEGQGDRWTSSRPVAISDNGTYVAGFSYFRFTPEAPEEGEAPPPIVKEGGQSWSGSTASLIGSLSVDEEPEPFEPADVNNLGVVVGNYFYPQEFEFKAVSMVKNGESYEESVIAARAGEANAGFVATINNAIVLTLAGGKTGAYPHHPAFWIKVGNQWSRSLPTKEFRPATGASNLDGAIIDVNDRHEAIGAFDLSGTTFSIGELWSNGRLWKLDSLVSGWRNIKPKDINNKGAILALAKKLDLYGMPGNGEHKVLLISFDLAVDANRDGVIKFVGNHNSTDPDLVGKPLDKTEEAMPFRFWVNDDYDGIPNSERDVVDSVEMDYEDGTIQTARDLEDFTRLALHVGAFYQEISNGTFTIGLKWRNTNGTNPSIQIYQSTDTGALNSYVRDEQTAFNQINGGDAETLGEVVGTTPLILPVDFWSGYSEQDSKRYLLFEGSGEGKGQLVMTIHKSDGTEIGEGSGVWLDIKNIKKMYVRDNGSVSNYTPPYGQTSYTGVQTQNGSFDNIQFEEPDDEKNEVIIFVHGIHSPGLTDPEKIKADWYATCETTFKRLWHQGYKGRFAAYKWAALTPGLPFKFNESEYRGWNFGNGLAEFVNSIPQTRKTLIAHSQGNTVCGAALRSGNLTVENYVLMQAAVPAGCYDNRNNPINNYQRFLDEEVDRPTPDATDDLGYRGYLDSLNVTRRVVNFNNREDFALVTGATFGLESNWEKNQVDHKPNVPVPYGWSTDGYLYKPPKEIGHRCELHKLSEFAREVSDIRESISYVARPRSQAIGALDVTRGAIHLGVDLNASPYYFTSASSEHGGQWSRPIQRAWVFYTALLDIIAEE